MSLLDDLRQRAEELKREGRDRESQQAAEQAYYDEHLRPALRRIHAYLIDLLKQLDIVQPRIEFAFILPGYGEVGAEQVKRSISIDSYDGISRISLRLEFEVARLQFQVHPPEQAAATRDLLLRFRQPFREYPVRAPNGELEAIGFVLQSFRIPAGLDIRGDCEGRRLDIYATNLRGLGSLAERVRPEQIDEEWLDRLGHFVTNQQAPALSRLDISEADVEAIRQQLEAAKAADEVLLAQREAEDLAVLEQTTRARLNRLLKNLRARFSVQGRRRLLGNSDEAD